MSRQLNSERVARSGGDDIIGWGCSDGKPSVTSSMEEATVKGIVKIKGKPATKGEVIFDPSNYRRKDAQPRTAPIKSDGTYEIKTLVGENTGGPEAANAGSSYVTFPIDVKGGGVASSSELTRPLVRAA